MSPRLASRVWIDAYLRRLQGENIPAFVTRKGDATAGAVIVKLATLDGAARAFHREYDLMSGERRWSVLAEGVEAEVDAAVSRQAGYDPDLWVLEIEDRAGRTLLDEDGLN